MENTINTMLQCRIMKIDVRLWHVENDFVQLWVIVDYRQVEHSGRVTILRIDKEGIGVIKHASRWMNRTGCDDKST